MAFCEFGFQRMIMYTACFMCTCEKHKPVYIPVTDNALCYLKSVNVCTLKCVPF